MIWLQKCGVFPNSPGWIYFRQYFFPFTPGLRGVTSFWRFCEMILKLGMGIPPAVISTVIHLTNSCLFPEGRVNIFFRLLEETGVRRSYFPPGFSFIKFQLVVYQLNWYRLVLYPHPGNVYLSKVPISQRGCLPESEWPIVGLSELLKLPRWI